MKLAPKLTLALLAGVCTVLALNAYLRIRREVTLFEEETRRDLHVMGRSLAATLGAAWRAEGETRALDLLERVNESESHILIRWVWLDPHPTDDENVPEADLAVLRPIAAGEEVSTVLAPENEVSRIATYVPVQVPASRVGAIELVKTLEYKRDHVRSSVRRSILTAVYMALVSGGVALLLGWVFVGRPMRQLVEQARRVGQGDLRERLSLRQRDEIGQLAREMNLMVDRLDEANRRAESETAARIATIEQLRHADRLMTVGKLASGIAHELGTPLNVVGGRAKMIAADPALDGEVRENARIIAEQAGKIAQIVRQLLDFARRRTPRKERHDLRSLAEQTAKLLHPMAENQRVTIEIDGTPRHAEVDPSQFQQALANLTVNGIQAMPRGGTLRIAFREEEAQPPADLGGGARRCHVIEVSDGGEGIAPEHRVHLFEPFFTTKEVGKGTGLGLPVTWGIVREHGGWIDVESERGKGSVFRIFLPSEDPAQPAQAGTMKEGGTDAR